MKEKKTQTKRRATHSVFLDEKAFTKYKNLKELIKLVTNKRVNSSAVIDALITLIAQKNLVQEFLEIYQQKLAERKETSKEKKINLEEFIEVLSE